MGHYISRHAEYSTKEGTRCETPDQVGEGKISRIFALDPRSPSAEIIRTPIQVSGPTVTPKGSYSPINHLDTPASMLSTIATRSSEADLRTICDMSIQKEPADDFEELMESIEAELAEIEASYKPSVVIKKIKEEVKIQTRNVEPKPLPRHKLQFTPESQQTKVRTPLGVRSSNTPDNIDSPSAFLRTKQQRWLREEVHQKIQFRESYGVNCENTPPHLMTKAATLPRKRQNIEWDKDTTMII